MPAHNAVCAVQWVLLSERVPFNPQEMTFHDERVGNENVFQEQFVSFINTVPLSRGTKTERETREREIKGIVADTVSLRLFFFYIHVCDEHVTNYVPEEGTIRDGV